MDMRHLALVLIGLITTEGFAQTVVGGNAAKGMDMNAFPAGTVAQFGAVEKTPRGSKYLYNDWRMASIEVKSGAIIKNCPVNIDLMNRQLEVNTDIGVRIVPLNAVKTVRVGDENSGDYQIFVNERDYANNDVAMLSELVVEGEVSLLKRYYIYIKEPAYNQALDMGSNEIKFITKHDIFITDKDTFIEIPKSKEKFAQLFGENAKRVGSFMRENNLKLKGVKDLVKIVAFLNEKRITL